MTEFFLTVTYTGGGHPDTVAHGGQYAADAADAEAKVRDALAGRNITSLAIVATEISVTVARA